MRGRSRRSRRRWRRGAWLAGFVCLVALWFVPSAAPATVAEQRARLPPAAECGDEIAAGIWRSHAYNPRFGDWAVFTLTIRRVPGHPEQLVGTISNHSWMGGPGDQEPPPCARQRHWEWVVSMDAQGHVTNGNQIYFGGVGAWRLDETRCHQGPGGYNLDHFTGVIDPTLLEFQSVNNDGGRAVNEPAVFRRIRCPPRESVDAPSVNPRPPAFYPDMGRGCGWL